jgi:hypothetical protein
MAGDPAPLAAVQAAVLKQAAGKKAQTPAAESSMSNAVQQDLAIMADQAKGYTAGVNAGVIVEQDNRAAQARRLAAEQAQAQAEHARRLELEQKQTEMMRLRAETERQSGRFSIAEKQARLDADRRRLDADRRKAEESGDIPDEWVANADEVTRHAIIHAPRSVQNALKGALPMATSAQEALQIYRNAKRANVDWTIDVDERMLRSYAEEYFRALEGKAVRETRLRAPTPPQRRGPLADGPAGYARPPRPGVRDTADPSFYVDWDALGGR